MGNFDVENEDHELLYQEMRSEAIKNKQRKCREILSAMSQLVAEKFHPGLSKVVLSIPPLRLPCDTRSTLVEPGYPECSCGIIWHKNMSPGCSCHVFAILRNSFVNDHSMNIY